MRIKISSISKPDSQCIKETSKFCIKDLPSLFNRNKLRMVYLPSEEFLESPEKTGRETDPVLVHSCEADAKCHFGHLVENVVTAEDHDFQTVEY